MDADWAEASEVVAVGVERGDGWWQSRVVGDEAVAVAGKSSRFAVSEGERCGIGDGLKADAGVSWAPASAGLEAERDLLSFRVVIVAREVGGKLFKGEPLLEVGAG